MESRASFATGLGIGAVLMYWLDPERGRRRRALVRDRAIHAARVSRDAIGATGRDVMHRTYGTAAAVAGALSQPMPNDDALVARVRAKLGRVVSHPHAVDVTLFPYPRPSEPEPNPADREPSQALMAEPIVPSTSCPVVTVRDPEASRT